MSGYTQAKISQWIDKGFATAGGCGNKGPLIGRAGLNIALGVNLGRRKYDGLDIQGRTFHEIMTDREHIGNTAIPGRPGRKRQ